jgi:hypothetical protein
VTHPKNQYLSAETFQNFPLHTSSDTFQRVFHGLQQKSIISTVTPALDERQPRQWNGTHFDSAVLAKREKAHSEDASVRGHLLESEFFL